MAGGLVALLDDIATLAKAAAASLDDVAAAAGKASAKAAGVVVDDAAVTPKFVEGVTPARELPIIRKIATGSLVNKLVFILPLLLLLSQFAPWLLTPLLILGGTYLCFEGAEKVLEKFTGHGHATAAEVEAKDERTVVRGAIVTDFILSFEIMVIALNEVADKSLGMRAAILIVVAVFITVAVYGVVGVIVKMDDIGLALTTRPRPGAQRLGHALVSAMPRVLTAISVIGTAAMLWVGGHLVVANLAKVGVPWFADVAHAAAHAAGHLPLGGLAAWLADTLVSLVFGLAWGGIFAGLAHLLPQRKKH